MFSWTETLASLQTWKSQEKSRKAGEIFLSSLNRCSLFFLLKYIGLLVIDTRLILCASKFLPPYIRALLLNPNSKSKDQTHQMRSSIISHDIYDDDLDSAMDDDDQSLLLSGRINDAGLANHTVVFSDQPILGAPFENSPLESKEDPRSHVTYWTLYVLSLMALSSYWFGWSVLWMPLMVILMPLQIVQIAGEAGKGTTLGITILLGSTISIFCSPAFGAISDSCQHRLGRRRPFMVVGGVIATVSLLIMAFASTLGIYSIGFFCLSVANNMILAPYSALIPDIVPEAQRGIASGWLGGFSMTGQLIGGLITYKLDVLGVQGCYLLLIALHGLAVGCTVYYIHEEPMVEEPTPFHLSDFMSSFVRPLKSHDFRWLLFTRFLIQMGCVTVQENLQFYLKDAIRIFEIDGEIMADTAERAVSLLFLPLLTGALVSSIVSGFLSDLYQGRRKFLVYISGFLMSVCCLLFAITRSFAFDVLLGFIFGLGFGCFSAIDWAMATDCLPSKTEVAKDMGVWSLAFVLPQVLAAPIAGNLLDYFERLSSEWHLGYTIVFGLSSVYFMLGTYLIRHINAVK